MAHCGNEYETFEYGTGVTYGSPVCLHADELFLDIDSPARDMIQISTSVEFVVNAAYLETSNYLVVDPSNGKVLAVREVVAPTNSLVSNQILLIVDKHVAGTVYDFTLQNLVHRDGTVQGPTTGEFPARDAKANSMIAAIPDHFNVDPKTSTMRYIMQAISASDDLIGSLKA